MIESVRVKGYRAIDEIDLKLNQITVFVGRNNTGKSSILEALTLLFSSFNSFKDPITGQDLLKHIVELRGGYSSLMRDNTKTASIEATVKRSINIVVQYRHTASRELGVLHERMKVKLQLALGKDGFRNMDLEAQDKVNNLVYELAEENVYREIRRLQEKLESLQQERLLLEREGILRTGRYDKRIEDVRKKLEYYKSSREKIIEADSKEIIKNLLLTAVSFINNQPALAYIVVKNSLEKEDVYSKEIIANASKKFKLKFYARLVGHRISSPLIDYLPIDKMLYVIEELRKIIPYFIDYRNGKVVFKYGEKIEVVPLETTGEGFQALFELLPPAILGVNVMIIEEPESHLHPGFMESYSSMLLRLTKEYETQFIMSTHSLEFLENLLNQASENEMLDAINIVRMYRLPNGDLDYEILSGQEALSELEELGGDLRGP